MGDLVQALRLKTRPGSLRQQTSCTSHLKFRYESHYQAGFEFMKLGVITTSLPNQICEISMKFPKNNSLFNSFFNSLLRGGRLRRRRGEDVLRACPAWHERPARSQTVISPLEPTAKSGKNVIFLSSENFCEVHLHKQQPQANIYLPCAHGRRVPTTRWFLAWQQGEK